MTVSSAFMRLTQPLPSRTIVVAILGVIALVAGLAALTAQVTGDRGIAPVASSSDIDVTGIEVDVRGDTAEEARAAGWRKAQRDAWAKIGGPNLPDSQIDGMVSAIVIERLCLGSVFCIFTIVTSSKTLSCLFVIQLNFKSSCVSPCDFLDITCLWVFDIHIVFLRPADFWFV